MNEKIKCTFGAMPQCGMYKWSIMGMEGMKCEPMKLHMHYGVIVIPATHVQFISPPIPRVTPATHAHMLSPLALQWEWSSRKGQHSF